MYVYVYVYAYVYAYVYVYLYVYVYVSDLVDVKSEGRESVVKCRWCRDRCVR